MTTIREWYSRVNSVWPKEVQKPTPDEAMKAARKLYRFVTGKSWDGEVELTSGNRYTYFRGGVMYVNPDGHGDHQHLGGWYALVHDLSHHFHWRYGDGSKPHSRSHARLELRLAKEVVKRGWLTGTLKVQEKPEPKPVDEKLTKAIRIEAAIQRWEAKLKRAQNALKKLNRKSDYYKKHTSALSATVH